MFADAAWSPTPSVATPAELAHAVAICRSNYMWSAPGSRAGDGAFARAAPLVVAERRTQSYSIILSDGRAIANCLLPDPTRPAPNRSRRPAASPVLPRLSISHDPADQGSGCSPLIR